MAIKCIEVKGFTRSDGVVVQGHERCIDTTTGQVVNSTEGQTETPQGGNQGNPNEICIEIQSYFRSNGEQVKKHVRCIDPSSLSAESRAVLTRIKTSLESAPTAEAAQSRSLLADRFLRNNFGEPNLNDVPLDGKVFELVDEPTILPNGELGNTVLNGPYEVKRRTDGGEGFIAVSAEDGSIELIADNPRFYGTQDELNALSDTGFSINNTVNLSGEQGVRELTGETVTLDGPYLALQNNADGTIDVWGGRDDSNAIYTIQAKQEAFNSTLTRVYTVPSGEGREERTVIIDPRQLSAERLRGLNATSSRIEEGILPALSATQLDSRLNEIEEIQSRPRTHLLEVRSTQSSIAAGGTTCFNIPAYARADGTIIDAHERCVARPLLSEADQNELDIIRRVTSDETTVNAVERLDNSLARMQDRQGDQEEVKSALELIQEERQALFEKYGGFNAQHNSEFDYLPKSYTDKELEVLNEFHIDALQERNELVAQFENVETSEVLEYNEIQIEEILRDNGYVYFDNGRYLLDLTGSLTDEAGEIQKLDVSSNGDGSFDVGVKTDRLRMDRVIADYYVKNDYFTVNAAYRGQGIGTSVFANQVFQLEQYAYYGIETQAASGGGYNGFYTWAVLGYQPTDKSYLDEFLDGTPFDFGEFGEITTFEELFAEEGGRTWWKQNGSGWSGFFNTRNSEHDFDVSSIDMLNRYLRRKGLRTID